MAGEKLGYVFSALAAADHSAKNGYAVVINGGSAGLPQVAIAGAGVKIDGVISRGDVSGKVERIAKTGIVYGVVGATISAAGEVEVNASGQFITKSAGVAVGKVFAAAAANDIVPVFLY